MSYITLTNQYKETLIGKIVKYIKFELSGIEIEFDKAFFVNVPITGKTERWICKGITEQGLLTGRNLLGKDVDFEIKGLDVDTLSHIIDQLMEVDYHVIHLDP